MTFFLVSKKNPEDSHERHHVIPSNPTSRLMLNLLSDKIQYHGAYDNEEDALEVMNFLITTRMKDDTKKILKSDFLELKDHNMNCKVIVYLGEDLTVSPGVYSLFLSDCLELIEPFPQTRIANLEEIRTYDHSRDNRTIVVRPETFEVLQTLKVREMTVDVQESSLKRIVTNPLIIGSLFYITFAFVTKKLLWG